MTKSYILDGLDCANCASKIEDKINKIPGINGATVNFMTTKLTVEAPDDEFEEIMKKAIDIIKKFEPDIEIKKY